MSPAAPAPAPAAPLTFPTALRSFLDPYLPDPSPGSTTTTTTPHVTLTYATSLDSAISLAPGVQTALSGPLSKAMTHYLRAQHDAILVGVGTAVADDPGLNCRLQREEAVGKQDLGGLSGGSSGADGGIPSHQPQPVVLDPRGRWAVHQGSRVVRTAREGKGRAVWVVCAQDVEYPAERRAVVEGCGGKVISVPGRRRDEGMRMDWRDVLAALAQQGIRSVMVEGGATVIDELLRPACAGLVAALVVTIAPVYLGQGAVHVNPEGRVNGAGERLPAARLRHVVWQPLGEDVVLCARLDPC